MRRDMWNWVILYQFHTNVLICVIFACDNSVCLIFFASFAGSQRAHASGALASFGSIRRRKKNNAEENRRLTKNITNQNNVQLFLTTHDVRA